MKFTQLNRIALFTTALALMVSVAHADSYWNGGVGDWEVDSNWSTLEYPRPGGGYDSAPAIASYGSLDGTITLNADLAALGSLSTLYFGRGVGTGDPRSSTLRIASGASLTTANYTTTQVGGSGAVDAVIVNEGTFTQTSGTFGIYGAAADQSQRFVTKAGSVTTINGGGIGAAPDVGTAELEVQGGTFTGNTYFNIAGNGHVKVSGGTFTNGATATIYMQNHGMFEVIGGDATINLGVSGGSVNFSTSGLGTWKFTLADSAADPISTINTPGFATSTTNLTTITVDATALYDAAAIGQSYTLIDATSGVFDPARFIIDVDSDYGHLVFDDGADTISYVVDAVQVLQIPEPASMTLLALGGLAMLKRRRR